MQTLIEKRAAVRKTYQVLQDKSNRRFEEIGNRESLVEGLPPMLGAMLTPTILTRIVVPVIFEMRRAASSAEDKDA